MTLRRAPAVFFFRPQRSREGDPAVPKNKTIDPRLGDYVHVSEFAPAWSGRPAGQ